MAYEEGTGGDASAGISARDLRKRYGEQAALDGFTPQVRPGTVCGLLGPNGAGKTTAVRILTTLLRPDAGAASVAGYDVIRHPGQGRLVELVDRPGAGAGGSGMSAMWRASRGVRRRHPRSSRDAATTNLAYPSQPDPSVIVARSQQLGPANVKRMVMRTRGQVWMSMAMLSVVNRLPGKDRLMAKVIEPIHKAATAVTLKDY